VGPGLDVLGCAIAGARDEVIAEWSDEPGITVLDSGHPELSSSPTRHTSAIAAAAVLHWAQRLGATAGGEGIALTVKKGLPLSGGQGGSAASAVAGAAAANALFGGILDTNALLECGLVAEAKVAGRHLDNIAPALLGGITLIRCIDPIDVVRLPVPTGLRLVLAHPAQRLSTAILKAMDEGDNGPGAEYNVYPKEFTAVYDARRKLVGKQLYTLIGVPRGDAAGMLKQFRKNYDFFDAPVGMILCVERRMGNGQWIDCGIFLDQLMLLAREKGLHTCPQAAFSRYQHVVRRELGIADDQVVICGLALGYADPDAVPNNLITERAPIQDFTKWFSE